MDITNKYNERRLTTNSTLNGKVMFCSVVLLFIVVFIIACFHSYVRCSSHRRRRRRRHNRLLISLTTLLETTRSSTSPKALDPSVLKTLPIFTYYATSAAENSLVAPPVCAVCLSEFEDGDGCCVLPKCSHSFHVECIDTWFKSQSNCPLCRAPVQPEISVPPPEISITVIEPAGSKQQDRGNGEPGSSRCSPSTSFPAEECGRAPMVGVSVEEVPISDRYRSVMDIWMRS